MSTFSPDLSIEMMIGGKPGLEFHSNGEPVSVTTLYLNYSWLVGYYEAYQMRRAEALIPAVKQGLQDVIDNSPNPEFDEEYDRWLEMVDLDNTLAEMTGRD